MLRVVVENHRHLNKIQERSLTDHEDSDKLQYKKRRKGQTYIYIYIYIYIYACNRSAEIFTDGFINKKALE